MSDDITFRFYSDTNQAHAFDELSGLSLSKCEQVNFDIVIGAADYNAMDVAIQSIVSSYGGEETF